jgi:hypothetical protein
MVYAHHCVYQNHGVGLLNCRRNRFPSCLDSWHWHLVRVVVMISIDETTVTFHKAIENGLALQELGRIEFSDTEVKFEGNFDESSVAFFGLVSKHFQESLKLQYQRGYEDCLTEEAKK